MGTERLAIRQQVSMRDALELLGMSEPDLSGKIVCPFHEELTPSFHLYEDHGACYGCGWNGDVVWFVAQVTGSPIWRAEKFLAGACDIDMADVAPSSPVVREVKDFTDVVDGLTEAGPMLRELAEKLVADRWPYLTLSNILRAGWRIGRDGLWIPHRHDGGITGVKIRTWNGKKTALPGSTFSLAPYFSWYWSTGILPRRLVFIAEGEPDTVALVKAIESRGVVIGLPSGAGAHLEMVAEWVRRRSSRAVLCLDADPAGAAASATLRAELEAGGVEVEDLSLQMSAYGADVCDALAAGWVPSV